MMGGAGLAFFALIGFEDSVNVAEETKEPARDYPRALFGGLAAAGVDLPAGHGARLDGRPDRPARRVRRPAARGGRPGPLGMSTEDLLRHRAVRAGQRRADQHDHGLAAAVRHGAARASCRAPFGACTRARQTPWVAIVFTTALAAALIVDGRPRDLADTTVLLLLVVFAMVNVCVLVLRRDRVATTTSARRPPCPSWALRLARADHPEGRRRAEGPGLRRGPAPARRDTST